jgi:adenosylhomocysteine nucleosidase
MSIPAPVGLVAVHREIHPLLHVLDATRESRQGDVLLYGGQCKGRAIALAKVLPGPVNAALGAQLLAVRHNVGSLISVGSAGALDPCLATGDLVVARWAAAHDAGTFLGQRFKPVGIMGLDAHGRAGYRRTFAADPDLLALALAAARSLDVKVFTGTVVTGNQIIFSTARKRWLHQTFDALAVDMETAAVAQVGTALRLPWLAVRAISDAADDDLAMDYDRLRVYLDEQRPAWQHSVRRWLYLLTHPVTWRQLGRLQKGLAQASGRAAQLVQTMILQ